MNAAQQHRNSESDIGKHEQSVKDLVEGLFATNKGDLMRKLHDVELAWSDQVDKMRKEISDMADYMDMCSRHLSDNDQSNTSWLPAPPTF